MVNFEKIFGIKPSEIKQTCILTPFLTQGLTTRYKIESLHKGWRYSAGNASDFTLIHTRIGSSMIGDCVLYLKDTACENILFQGTCGLLQRTKNHDIGSLVAPTHSFAMESFTEVLSGDLHNARKTTASPVLLKKLKASDQSNSITDVACATFGSLNLEPQKKDALIALGVDVLEMECSALFEAANYIDKKAAALLYITDIIGEDSYKNIFVKNDCGEIRSAEKQVVNILKGLSKTLC